MARLAGVLAAVAAFAAAGAASVPDLAPQPGLRTISVTSAPLLLNESAPAQSRVGSLLYLGGLVMQSGDPDFGGISGARWLGSGRLLALTDRGHWLLMDIAREADRPVAIPKAVIAPLLGEDGKTIADGKMRDSESLELVTEADGSSRAFVGFEHVHRIVCFASAKGQAPDLLMVSPADPLCNDLRGWEQGQKPNGGLEAIARTAMGSAHDLMAFAASEDRLNTNGGHDALLRTAGRHGMDLISFGIAREPGYKPTDAHWIYLKDGSPRLLLLLRSFSPFTGVRAKLQLLDLRSVQQGSLVQGERLAELVPPLAVDNMEALAVEQKDGRTIITLVSDDNFNSLQRTLLMTFEWMQRE
jgi:hypothetical protein